MTTTKSHPRDILTIRLHPEAYDSMGKYLNYCGSEIDRYFRLPAPKGSYIVSYTTFGQGV